MGNISKILQFDFIVIGSGIAGITYALKVAKAGQVALLTKKNRSDSNTNYAQGGIATVFNSDDSPQLHIQDTLEAGAGLCHLDVVEKVIAESGAAIEELIQIGVEFSKNKLMTVLPCSEVNFCSPSSRRFSNCKLKSKMPSISSLERSSIPKR